MSVNTNRFVGYTLDITDEFMSAYKENEDMYEKWIETCSDNDLERKAYLRGLGFKSYYDKDLKDNVILLYDGLNGQYAKLVYVIDYSVWSECDDMEENIISSINKLLAQTKIGLSTIGHLKAVYKAIFNKECTNVKDIKAEYIVHYN